MASSLQQIVALLKDEAVSVYNFDFKVVKLVKVSVLRAFVQELISAHFKDFIWQTRNYLVNAVTCDEFKLSRLICGLLDYHLQTSID